MDFICDICRRLAFSKSALVVTGPKTREVAGQRVADLLDDDGIDVACYVAASSSLEEIKIVEEKIGEIVPQVVLGVGGGQKIDVAKLSSANRYVPFMSVPTTASHDGIASPFVSLKGLDKPFSVMAQSPMAIVADTNVIVKSSHCFTASGCGDVVAKLTAVRDWRLAHEVKSEYYGEYAASLALMSARLVEKNAALIKPGGEEGLRVLLEALISCGVAMSIAGSSRPCSGSEHLFSHALDSVAPKPAMHGEQCGVGTIMMARLHNIKWRGIRETLKAVGAPTTAEELGVEPVHVVEALVKACDIRPDRYSILDERSLNHDSAEKLARSTGVI